MDILYRSTRGADRDVPASQAVLKGLSADGGLYVPQQFPKLEKPLSELVDMSYQDLAYEVMHLFLSDYTEEELRYCINSAYDQKFDTPVIAPLHEADGAYFLELFHGKTIAFKDMALSILPYLMTTAAKKNKITNEIVILTATSGDTGKAAMAGFADVPGTRIIVFYPKGGVSPVQERQMVTQKGANTSVVAIKGNFDDAQTAVKKIFGNQEMKETLGRAGFQFSSANSINIGRLVPQAVYYVYAYMQLVRTGKVPCGDPVNIVVPTGNFGNILAAYYAKQIGLPVAKLICASNENKVLYDFFRTGIYDKNRDFILTTSPSMDILVSSNLERLLYHAAEDDTDATAKRMASLTGEGRYTITAKMQEKMSDFIGGFASEADVQKVIRKIYEEDHYVIDTHTGVAAAVYEAYRNETGDQTPAVIASTASPYKFARAVLHAIDGTAYDDMTDLQQFDALCEVSGVKIPQAIEEIKSAPVLHDTLVEIDGMEDIVKKILGLLK